MRLYASVSVNGHITAAGLPHASSGSVRFLTNGSKSHEHRVGPQVASGLRLSFNMKRRGHMKFGAAVNVVPEGTRCETSPAVTVPVSGISLEGLERAVIAFALERHGGNQVQSARFLGLSRSALIYRMQKYRLRPHDRRRTSRASAQASRSSHVTEYSR